MSEPREGGGEPSRFVMDDGGTIYRAFLAGSEGALLFEAPDSGWVGSAPLPPPVPLERLTVAELRRLLARAVGARG